MTDSANNYLIIPFWLVARINTDGLFHCPIFNCPFLTNNAATFELHWVLIHNKRISTTDWDRELFPPKLNRNLQPAALIPKQVLRLMIQSGTLPVHTQVVSASPRSLHAHIADSSQSVSSVSHPQARMLKLTDQCTQTIHSIFPDVQVNSSRDTKKTAITAILTFHSDLTSSIRPTFSRCKNVCLMPHPNQLTQTDPIMFPNHQLAHLSNVAVLTVCRDPPLSTTHAISKTFGFPPSLKELVFCHLIAPRQPF